MEQSGCPITRQHGGFQRTAPVEPDRDGPRQNLRSLRDDTWVARDQRGVPRSASDYPWIVRRCVIPYIDGLPIATLVASTDLVAIDQGGITGSPGTATTRQATLSQILGTGPGAGFLPLIGGTLTGTLSANGAGTGLAVANNTTIGGTLAVTGTSQLTGAVTLSGNATVGGTLGVTGAQTGTTIDLTGAFNTTTTAGYKQSGSTVLTTRGTTQQSTLVGLGAGSLLPSNDTETTAVGWNALAACTGATLENTAVGWGSLRTLTTGFFNTAVGVNTGGLIVTDTDNALFGTDVMRDSTGGHNVAVGNGALRDGVHNQNVAIGHLAMTANGAVTANTANNVAVGYQTMSGAGITTASNNVMVGYTAGQVMTTGTNNTGVGSGALNRLTTGVFNATVGRNSLVAVTTGFNNAALGFNAGASITTGASNLVLGPAVASTTLTTGTGNILIGVTAAIDTPTAGTSNTFALGNHATNLMRATAINTAAPAFFLDWLPGSTTFANDAAAAVGGVAVGQVYRNGSVVQVRIT